VIPDGASGVDLNTTISVWFSRSMEVSSLDSVYVLEKAVAQRDYDTDEKKLTLHLDGTLDEDSTYHVRVASFCMDTDGNNLAEDYVFSFTTGVFPPHVTQTYPEDGASGVDLTTTVSVWFSKSMQVASLDSVYVLEGAIAQRDYDPGESRLTLHLDGMLDEDSTYHVRVASFCMDTDGNNLAQDYVFSFTAGAFDCSERADMFEPNDNVASAAPIEIGVTYPTLTSCGDQERWDFYEFTLDAAAKVTAITRMRNMDTTHTAWQIYWANAAQQYYTTLGSHFEEGDSIVSFHYTFLPGTYYVTVFKDRVDNHYVVYDLKLETSDPCPDDPYEDNDFWQDATPIAPGEYSGLRGCYLDGDYFAVDLLTGQTLTVTITEVTSSSELRRLVLYGPNMVGVAGDTDHDNPKTEAWTAEQDGTHYIEIRWWGDDIIYDLDIEVTD
jgi:hypothetical protein